MNAWLKKNFWTFLFGIFALVGTVLGLAGYGFWQSAQKIKREGIKTEGTVVSLQYHEGGTASPIIEFTTESGQRVTHFSSTSSNPPSYQAGEKVTLWYRPDNPQEVVISGIDSWLLPLVFGIFFVIFGGIGYGGLYWRWRVAKKTEWLGFNGKTLYADFSEIRYKTSTSMGGQSPYIILGQYYDKAKNKLYVYESEEIWFNPEPFIQPSQQLKVIVDPQDYGSYRMDISFLPELGN